ncbi:MAG: hypothetical protein OXC91_00745 [Rhodobacteraceae bacterium]|nr:hypothetical protein [Paracoccaceae bacterium]
MRRKKWKPVQRIGRARWKVEYHLPVADWLPKRAERLPPPWVAYFGQRTDADRLVRLLAKDGIKAEVEPYKW